MLLGATSNPTPPLFLGPLLLLLSQPLTLLLPFTLLPAFTRRRATVGLAARRESDSGSARTGREDDGGDSKGTRCDAVEGRSAIWCVRGTAGGRGRGARPLVRAARTGDAGRDAGSRRSARPPVGPV
ncbi:unnamed protein product [Closterium sp. NIES-53]